MADCSAEPGRSAQRIGLRLARDTARTVALSPELAASRLARRPCDLRHAALSLWLNAGGDPAQIAAYTHCIHGRDDLLDQLIDQVLETPA
jgi:hypothetical protein